MATWILVNNIQVGTDRLIAGSLIDDAQEDATAIRNAGGLLITSSNVPVAAAAALAQAAKLRGDDPAACAAIMQAGLETSQESEVTTPVTNATALAAITAANRSNGMEAVKLDDYTPWIFSSTSAEAASDWCIVPAAGTGRWLRSDQTRGVVRTAVANAAALIALTAVNRKDGTLVVKLDDMTVWSYDLGSVLTTDTWHIEPTDGVGCWFRIDVADGRVLPSVANNAGLIALTAIQRQDGSIVVQLDTMLAWMYDLGSAEAASDWCVLPTDAVGRWLRLDQVSMKKTHLPVADAAAVSAITAPNLVAGMIVCKLDDNTLWTYSATSAEAASSTCLAAAGGVGRWLFAGARWGVPMTNRIRLLNATVKIAQADFLTIGGIVYEFRDDTPPTGGTAGRVWIYNGANAAASRVNFIDAINGVVDATRINYNGVVKPLFVAAAGVTAGDVIIQSATAAGGTPCPSATATACTDNITTVTDIWDSATCYGGVLPVAPMAEGVTVTLTAAHIAKGNVQFNFTFAPRLAYVWNRNRAQNEAWVVIGNSVSLTCAGAGSPNNQAADVVDCLAIS